MKILNLYAGIGGNRKLWPEEHEVTAVELNHVISGIYQDFFPDDKVVLGDAHGYLLKHYHEFDFIWSSPPCQSHSTMRKNVAVPRGQSNPVYPDMKLYQEIIFLQHHANYNWVVENVNGYYDPLIRPQESGGHYFWANFIISQFKRIPRNVEYGNNDVYKKQTGFDLTGYKLGKRKDQIYHNCVNSKLGLHIFDCAFKIKQTQIGKW